MRLLSGNKTAAYLCTWNVRAVMACDAPANERAARAREIASGMLHDWLLSNTTHNTGENLGFD